jgi:hypothetical protein
MERADGLPDWQTELTSALIRIFHVIMGLLHAYVGY